MGRWRLRLVCLWGLPAVGPVPCGPSVSGMLGGKEVSSVLDRSCNESASHVLLKCAELLLAAHSEGRYTEAPSSHCRAGSWSRCQWTEGVIRTPNLRCTDFSRTRTRVQKEAMGSQLGRALSWCSPRWLWVLVRLFLTQFPCVNVWSACGVFSHARGRPGGGIHPGMGGLPEHTGNLLVSCPH